MALNEGWYYEWFKGGYYPTVWFAPADESGVDPSELQPTYSQEIEIAYRPRKVAIKKGKKLLIFDNQEQAEAWEAAQEAIEKAQKASRRARKRLRERVFAPLAHPVEIDPETLTEAVKRFDMGVEIAPLIAKQDYLELVRVALMAQQMQDEDDIELLLLAL